MLLMCCSLLNNQNISINNVAKKHDLAKKAAEVAQKKEQELVHCGFHP